MTREADLNTQLKKLIDDALNTDHFKDFKTSMLSRPLRDWYQQLQELLAMFPPAPGGPPPSDSKASKKED